VLSEPPAGKKDSSLLTKHTKKKHPKNLSWENPSISAGTKKKGEGGGRGFGRGQDNSEELVEEQRCNEG